MKFNYCLLDLGSSVSWYDTKLEEHRNVLWEGKSLHLVIYNSIARSHHDEEGHPKSGQVSGTRTEAASHGNDAMEPDSPTISMDKQ
jgi:hypothetical protein